MSGATSAGAALLGGVAAGTAAGVWLAQRTGASWWFIAGFFAGVLAGGFAALRLLYGAAGK
ncbi:MAG: AtpZ/AtpI family protein [Candidatus Baltobacteraceae bacterium]